MYKLLLLCFMQLPVGANDAELEERIIQHLAAAAAMGRARHIARREGQRNRSSAQGRPQFLVFSTHPNSPPATSAPVQRGEGEPAPAIAVAALSSPHTTVGEEPSQLTSVNSPQAEQVTASASGSTVLAANQRGSYRYPFDATSLQFFYIILSLFLFHKIKIFFFVLLLPCTTIFTYFFHPGGLLANHYQVVQIEQDLQKSNHFQNQ